jgi:8-oxo-dGTP pyrophosphatase MutT (NUDIX family)
MLPGTDAHLAWKEISRRRIAASPYFALDSSERSSPDGRSGEFWILRTPDWVTVVPLLRTGDGEESLLMVRQYRHGAEMMTTEFPAGLVEEGEDPAAAAARELLEETGYGAGRLSPLGVLRPNPAFMSNRCFTFLAEDLQRSGGRQSLDELESVEPLVLPMSVVEERMGRGEFVNALTVTALDALRRHRAGRR